MFKLIWTLSVRTNYYLRRYAPTNILLDAIRSRRGLRWGVPAMLVAVPYLLIVCFCANLLAAGGPGVLNLVVLGAGYNALRFVLMGPWSLVLLVRVRLQEAAGRRRARTSRDGGDTMDAFLAHASR